MMANARSRVKGVNRGRPCEVCQGTDGCTVTEDGLLLCRRCQGDQPGFVCLGPAKRDAQWTQYRREGDPVLEPRHSERAARNGKSSNATAVDWNARATKFKAALTPAPLAELAAALALPETVFDALHVGWCKSESCWTFPESDGAGQIIGIGRRFRDGSKKAMPSGHRGLTIPCQWLDREGPVFLPEGPSDTLALIALGLAAVGRPFNTGGIELLAMLLHDIPADRRLIVLGENDANQKGDWPGRDGAVKTAAQLQSRLGRLVEWALPPDKAKDVRDWASARNLPRGGEGILDAWQTAGEEFVKVVLPHAKPADTLSQGTTPSGKQGEKKKPELVVRSFSDIEPEAILWLWEPWLVRGALNLLDGDPGLGKSTIVSDLAARVSRGWPMPPLPRGTQLVEPADVLLLSAEDDAARTIRPRLDAAGADLTRVHILDAVKEGDSERLPILPFDLDTIGEEALRMNVALIVVDPLMAFLGSEVDAHRDQDVRRALHQIKLLAERTGAAVLVIRHLNKMTGGEALYRGGGSIGIIGAARSALVVGRDPNDKSRKVLCPNKCNLAAPPPSLAYDLETSGNVSRIAWGDKSDLTATDVLGKPRGKKKSEKCAEAMQELLADGEMLVNDLQEKLKTLGYSENAIREAYKVAGVEPHKVGFADGVWMARFTNDSPQEEAEEGG